jgi:hypothetical protein
MIKETPTYSKKKYSETPKMMGGATSVKKIFRCNSQKSPKFGSMKDDYVQSPLSTTYKEFKALKESFFNSGKNASAKKSSSMIGSMKEKPEKPSSISSLLNKFSKASSTQPNFGMTTKYGPGGIKSYL